MSIEKGKKKAKTSNGVSWQEKRLLADEEEHVLNKEIDDLKTWTNVVDKMNDDQLRNYLRNRPDHLKTIKTTENAKPTKSVQKSGKEKTSESNRIMASVWKFHKDEKDDHEGSSTQSNV